MTTGVLVMAYGTPTTPEDIEAYYTRIRHGRAPTPELLTDLTRRYDAIGGTSPLATRTNAQVQALAAELERRRPGEFDVRFGAKYEPPLIEETAVRFLNDDVTEVVGLVLAPHSSSMSTDQYMDRARAAMPGVTFHPIGAWWSEAEFLDVIGHRVIEALSRVDDDRREATEVIFSAHSLPTAILERGDDYPDQLAESARLAAQRAGLSHYGLAWQSAGRTADSWLGPDILAVLRERAAAGVRAVVSCPIGFVADHLEVLYDIDVEAQGVAHEIDLQLVRTRSLNDDPAFISVLANVIERTL